MVRFLSILWRNSILLWLYKIMQKSQYGYCLCCHQYHHRYRCHHLPHLRTLKASYFPSSDSSNLNCEQLQNCLLVTTRIAALKKSLTERAPPETLDTDHMFVKCRSLTADSPGHHSNRWWKDWKSHVNTELEQEGRTMIGQFRCRVSCRVSRDSSKSCHTGLNGICYWRT